MEDCTCGLYKSPLLLVAQIISIVSFLMFFFTGWWLSWLCGLTAMVLVLCGACWKIGRGGFFTAGAFASITAVAQLVFAVEAEDYYYQSLYCSVAKFGLDFTGCGGADHIALGYISAITWASAAAMIFIVAAAKLNNIPLRMGASEEGSTNIKNHQGAETTTTPITAADVVGQQEQHQKRKGTVTTKSTTVLPDGTRKTEIITKHPDGSKTIERIFDENREPPPPRTDEEVEVEV